MKTEEEKENFLGGSLPTDLITKILLRLPVKPLLRYKSACKDWYSIISNPTFTKSQLGLSFRHHLSLSHLIIRKDNSVFTRHLDLNDIHHNTTTTNEIKGGNLIPTTVLEEFIQSPPENFMGTYFRCLGSCNGIICILQVLDRTNNIILLNPTINESRLISLPFPTITCIDCWYFDCFRLVGFGYAPTINDYKIVLVTEHKRDCKCVYVYSLRNNKWTELEAPPLVQHKSFGNYRREEEAVVLNDALHWVMKHGHSCVYDHYILKFDMVNEIFERAADLNKIGRSYYKEITVLKETKIGVTDKNELYVCQQFSRYIHGSYLTNKPDVVEMRVWDDKRKSWVMKYKLDGKWNDIEDERSMLKVTGNGEVILFSGGYTPRLTNVLIFDGRKHKGKYIRVHYEHREFYESISIVVNYIQSLISPNSI